MIICSGDEEIIKKDDIDAEFEDEKLPGDAIENEEDEDDEDDETEE